MYDVSNIKYLILCAPYNCDLEQYNYIEIA